MMKQFFWKIALCVIPVLLASAVVADAFFYDRFKLGVDLVGGTILVYEIDARKTQVEGKETQDAKTLAANLAEKLKSRIDPTDTYNVVIRPIGNEGRVEIILPTGGQERAKLAEKEWGQLLRKLEQKPEYGLKPNSLDVPRGQVQSLTDRILQMVQERVWEKQLFNSSASLKELLDTALGVEDPKKPKVADVKKEYKETVLVPLDDEFKAKDRELKTLVQHFAAAGLPALGAVTAKQGPKYFQVLLPFETDINKTSLHKLMDQVKERVNDYSREREIDGWFKQQAWKKLIGLVLEKYPSVYQGWPDAETHKDAFFDIPPDAIDELVGAVEMKGDTLGQAFLYVMEGMCGGDVLSAGYVTKDKDLNLAKPDAGKFLDPNKVREFVTQKYGPSAQMILDDIKTLTTESHHRPDVTVEEVQRIKDLVPKMGSLEFLILANDFDDKDAIKDAEKMSGDARLSGSDLKNEFDDCQIRGVPPPPPRQTPGPKEPKVYTIKLRGGDSQVTYRWVELGKQSRNEVGLQNTALQDLGPRGAYAWTTLNAKVGLATQIEIPAVGGEPSDRKNFKWQGALFYKRECKDRNLPEGERLLKKYEYFVLARNPEIDPITGRETPKIDGSLLARAYPTDDASGGPCVGFEFKSFGARLFGTLTGKNIPTGEGSAAVKRHLAIVFDDKVTSAPTINSQISDRGQISGSYTKKDVQEQVNILNGGALPASLKPQPVSESTMSATLGADTIFLGTRAVIGAFLVVLAFMIVYYRFAGLVASVALLANLILTVGFMVAVKATFTLPGLAGLVLMLGMAVDANILIYERLREERERGASLLTALRNGYDRAFPTIIDTHLSSIFTAIVLYVVGNDQLKGFGVTMTVGLLISLFTSLYMTRTIFDLWAVTGWLKKLSMMRLFARPDIDFMTIRYYLFAATGGLTILGMALFIGRLPDDLNIDFVGGTAYAGQLEAGQAMSIEKLRDQFSAEKQKQELTAKAREVDETRQIYEVYYGDGSATDTSKRTVNLANPPAGETKAERLADVAKRASVLPDHTVEQIFLSTQKEADPNKSRYFSIRTTEKEPEIVQAVLDRLLQKDGKPMLQKMEMKKEPLAGKAGREYRVRFVVAGTDDPISASPSFVTSLFARELLHEFQKSKREDLPLTFELLGEGQMDEGRFKVAKLSIIPLKKKALDPAEVVKVEKALDKTLEEFRNRPQPDRLETFDSQLAADTRLRAMYAILAGWAAILGYLWLRFGSWTFGLAAVLCLIHDLFFTLGVIAACHYVNGIWPGFLLIEDFKIDLPAVAALLTLVGYSVNDTIVVFDRIREVRGKNPDLTAQMINDSVNQTLSRTILSSLTTWLVVIVLYIAGGSGVHLFAFVMVVGVVVGTYSSIYVASPLLLLFGEGGKATARTTDRPPAPTVEAPDTRIQPATP
jgi:SecD/SecF fusion protein